MFKTKLIDAFYESLFCTNFNGCSCATQNAKTDYLFECDSFEAWLVRLVKVFSAEIGINPDDLKVAVLNDSEFVNRMEEEYEELKELCDEDDYEDDEE